MTISKNRRCFRCLGVNGISPLHCKGNDEIVIRPGEKARILNCKCECNDFGKVQGNDAGHVKLTQAKVYGHADKIYGRRGKKGLTSKKWNQRLLGKKGRGR
ncbi:hypothetical protein CMI37_05980 [Candidatus Pacearchaeota archaeon]|nr:hypothetical protein [Candidatus Pacearchaeota archaeon]